MPARTGSYIRSARRHTHANPDVPASPSADALWACLRLAAARAAAAPARASGALPVAPAALELPDADLRAAGVGLTEKQAARLREAARAPVPARLRERAQEAGVSAVTFRDGAYPANLLPLADAPPLLFVRGALRPDDRFGVAIVGSRRATRYGQMQAERFARAFTERGLAVISGGAAGIDTAAHQGALAGEGRTIAVLGCGVDVAYPAGNRALFARIVACGGASFPSSPCRHCRSRGASRRATASSPGWPGAWSSWKRRATRGRSSRRATPPSTAATSGRSPAPLTRAAPRGHQAIQDGAALADTPEDVLAALGIAVDPRPAAPRRTARRRPGRESAGSCAGRRPPAGREPPAGRFSTWRRATSTTRRPPPGWPRRRPRPP